MDLDFTEEQEMLRTMVRDFVEKECPKTLVRELEDGDLGYSPEIWKKMAELGLLGIIFPEDCGGMGGGFVDLAIILEEMGRSILPGPYFSTVVLGGVSLLLGGTDEQKQEYLAKIASGEIIVAFALMEPTGTYDPSGVCLTAKSEGDEYVLNGTKLFVPDAKIADCMVVVARTKEGGSPEEGITLFLVDAKSPGITCEVVPTMGWDKQCEVAFDNVKVPGANILGELHKGWDIVQDVLLKAAALKCAEMSGGCQAMVDMCNDYAKERVQYRKPIGAQQVIQHYLADMWLDSTTMRSITYETVWKMGEGIPCVREIAAAKAWSNQAYRRAVDKGIQIHGAIGITRDHDAGLYYRRAKVSELMFGDTDYMRDLMAKELGM